MLVDQTLFPYGIACCGDWDPTRTPCFGGQCRRHLIIKTLLGSIGQSRWDDLSWGGHWCSVLESISPYFDRFFMLHPWM